MYRLFTVLLKASVYENSDTLYAAITQNAFPVQLDSDCFEQLGSLLTSTTAPESIVPYIQDIESLASYTKLYTVLDAKLKQYFERIQLCLEQLYATVPYREKISVVFDILRKHPYCAEKNHLMQMISLRRQLQNALPFIHTKEDLIFLCAYLDTMTASSFMLSTDMLWVVQVQAIRDFKQHQVFLMNSILPKSDTILLCLKDMQNIQTLYPGSVKAFLSYITPAIPMIMKEEKSSQLPSCTQIPYGL